MKDYMKIYQEWLSNPYFDEATKAELKAIEGDENEIKERFYMDLEFGTAGLRGIIGAGINRMNIYVSKTGHTGTGKLHYQAGRCRQGRSHCPMTPAICLRICHGGGYDSGSQRNQGIQV